MTHKIELKKDERRMEGNAFKGRKPEKRNPGGFDVYVDGELWGRFWSESCGPHGMKYTLNQIAGGRDFNATIEVPTTVNPRFNHGKTTRTSTFVVWSDKVYLRNLKPNQPRLVLSARMIASAKDAIARGGLRDPAAVIADAAESSAAFRAKQETAKAERRAEWEAKVREALGDGPMQHTGAATVAAIIGLMEWAQSR